MPLKDYFIDCGAGIAGDMLLGAWIGLGLSARELERVLKRGLNEYDWRLKVTDAERQQWPARTVKVVGDRPFGGPAKMRAALHRFALPPEVKTRATRVLNHLEWAERQAHGHAHGNVVFEAWGLGLMDTLVDVVGNLWAVHKLGIQHLSASAVNTGRLAPASVHLANHFRIPVYGQGVPHELATPTGIALLGELSKEFGPMPEGIVQRAGYGAGAQDFSGRPNVLAVYEREASLKGLESVQTDRVVEFQTLIDDMDPRLYPHVSEQLFAAGALDVWWIAAGMKKGRPGIAFHVLGTSQTESALLAILFKETTTLGIRRLPLERRVLARQSAGYEKSSRLPGGGTKTQIEFEVAKQRAADAGGPLIKFLTKPPTTARTKSR